MTKRAGMLVVIRADASSGIGTGHIIRCLGLASEMQQRGHVCVFVCREEPHNLISFIRQQGFHCLPLQTEISKQADEAAAVQAICHASTGRAVDLFIVDHYQRDRRFEAGLRNRAPVAVIDDLADRPHDCDLIVDVTHSTDEIGVYDGLVPPDCRRLIGQQFLMLRDEFRSIEQSARKIGPVKRILVTLGGNDPVDFTSRVIEALQSSRFSDISVDVTVGLSNPRIDKLRSLASECPRIFIHIQHSRISRLMIEADLCIGAGGMTIWECCYLGLPTLNVMLAENQRHTCTIMDRTGAARFLGIHNEISQERLIEEISRAVTDNEWRTETSRKGQKLVDGMGLARVTDGLEELSGLVLPKQDTR